MLSLSFFFEEHEYSLEWRTNNCPHKPRMDTLFIAGRKLVYQSSHNCRDKAPKRCRCSIGRPPTASGDREQDIPDRLQPVTEGLVERAAGSYSSAGETIPTTRPPHIPARPSNKSGVKHNLFTYFPKDTGCDIYIYIYIHMQPHNHRESSMQNKS